MPPLIAALPAIGSALAGAGAAGAGAVGSGLGALGSAAGTIGSGLGGTASALGAGNLGGAGSSLSSMLSGLGGVGNKLAYDTVGNFIPGMGSGTMGGGMSPRALVGASQKPAFSTMLERNVLTPMGGALGKMQDPMQKYQAGTQLAGMLQPRQSYGGVNPEEERRRRMLEYTSKMGVGRYT